MKTPTILLKTFKKNLYQNRILRITVIGSLSFNKEIIYDFSSRFICFACDVKVVLS